MTYLTVHQGMNVQVISFYSIMNNATIKILVKYTYLLMLGMES